MARICYISDRVPHPARDGTSIRLYHVGRGLRAAGDVTLVCTAPEAADQGALDSLGFDCRVHAFPLAAAHPRTSSKLLGTPRWGAVGWGGVGPELDTESKARLHDVILSCDLVWIARLGTALRMGITRSPGRPTIVDLDDLNQTKYALAAPIGKDAKTRMRYRIARWRWKRRESRAVSRFDGLGVCSPEDRALLGHRANIRVIPNGFESGPFPEGVRGRRVGFIGTLDYWANRDGLQWFLQNVWPELHRTAPDLEFRIVGRGAHMPATEQPGVTRLGFIEDANAEWATWSALAVPLRIGAGTRIKILEAFARKCPVVSTTIGAFGLRAVPGVHYLPGDTPADFSSNILKILGDPVQHARLARQAHEHFLGHFTWDSIEGRITGWVRDLLGQRATP